MKFIAVVCVHIQENLFGKVRNPSLLGHSKYHWQKRTRSNSSIHSEITVTSFVSLGPWAMANQHKKEFWFLYAFSSALSVLWVKSYCNKCGSVMEKWPSQPLNSNIVEKRAPPSAKCCFLVLRCLHTLLSSGCLDFSVFLQFTHPKRM